MYSFKSRVRYSEINDTGKISIPSIVDYLQDCSTFHSEDIELGIKYLKQEKKAWIISSWQIQILEYPVLGQEIKINTWAYDFKSFYGYRNFTITDKNDKILVQANSIWVFLDLEAGRPVKLTQDELNGYKLEEKLNMDYTPRKIKKPSKLTVSEKGFYVRKSQIDTNGHMNNSQYIKIASEAIPRDTVITQVRAEYKKAAKEGDYIGGQVNYENDKITVVLANENETYAIVEFCERK